MTPPSASAPSPTVDEGMREAVAQDIAKWQYGALSSTDFDGYLLRPSGPIGSALAAREREWDSCAALAGEALGHAMNLLAIHERWKDASVDESAARIITVVCDECREAAQTSEARALAAEAENATLRASAERMEADHTEEIARLKAALQTANPAYQRAWSYCMDRGGCQHLCIGCQRAAGIREADFIRKPAALTPKEPGHG